MNIQTELKKQIANDKNKFAIPQTKITLII